MAETEIPQYFVCPISLQIMKDPVTAVTGITYDRESIEQWLLKSKYCMCPVSKQPLPRSSEFLIPNNTLFRLINAWCSANEAKAIDQIQKLKTPLDKVYVQKLVRDLEVPHLYQTTLEEMHALAIESEMKRTCMVEEGVTQAMIMVINKSFKEGKTTCLEEAIGILRLLWNVPTMINNMKPLVGENMDFVNSLTWTLKLQVHNNVKMVNEAMLLLKSTMEVADSTGSLNIEFFREMVSVLRNNKSLSQQAIKSALHVLIQTCPLGINRTRIVEAGAVKELIELELEKPEKSITELIFNLLAHLCSRPDGRKQFLLHAASIAMISKRILSVSPATDDRAIHIFALIAKYPGSNEVILEMLRVGAVSKLCMVMQAACASYLKEKARDILRLHSKVWNNSPCILCIC
ncbi:hypothetical protein TanjilG_23677 [Lupinus angustifolius]|uniref:U-box domain-containing protein n=1 Tax=Lupinus angustifolius TaxID=3871 RepID=A0A4P1RA35_LUPAN|nr:PREDICTED: E3 ubiquitin-protein ligase PUB23-like [Lupinus angustifolius]OIW05891.1 hypothetical protein TanjilG_23677 [Lupinus angustifolius]